MSCCYLFPMSEEQNAVGQHDKKQPQQPRNTRSPAYPMLSLPDAVEMMKKLWESHRKHPAHVDSVLTVIGYKSKSGTALRAVAALGHFGLTTESGKSDQRKITVSERAQDIIHLPPTDPRYSQSLRAAALEPAIYKELWDRYGKSLPDDSAIRPFLIRDKGYNDSSALEVIKTYRETFEFAKLGELSEHNQQADSEKQVAQIKGSPETRSAGVQPPLAKSNVGMTQTIEDQELPVLVGNGRIARIPFPMSDDDYELLIGTLNLWKKKLTRPTEKVVPQLKFPFVALWKNKDFDKMVKIVGQMGERSGEIYYQSEDGTGIPFSELFPDAPPKS